MSRFSLGFHDGIETTIKHEGDSIIIEDSQDVTPILNEVSALKQIGQNKQNPVRHVGSIPMTEYIKWKREFKEKYAQNWTWQTYIAMKLNSRDFSRFRTEDVRI